MAFPFTITEHTVDCQYMREYPRAITPQDAPLKLNVKKYTPVDNPNPQPGDVTLIGAPGAGCAKELYEPLWEDIVARSKQDGFRIRAIWVADSFNHGSSGVLNEGVLGNDPSWHDHSRDLLQMVQQLREHMPQPIMGVAHSAGAVSLMLASLMHPRLFKSLLLLEPFVHKGRSMRENTWIIARSRLRDVWPSREHAAAHMGRVTRAYDPRVRERYVKYTFRELPTGLYPDGKGEGDSKTEAGDAGGPVTFTTPVAQEVALFIRPNLKRHAELGRDKKDKDRQERRETGEEECPPHDSLFVPDMVGPFEPGRVYYRPEGVVAWALLPHIRPGALYVSGDESVLSKSGLQKRAAEKTGTGIGGSGGMAYGMVQHVVLDKAGHMIPFDRVGETADLVGPWIAKEVKRWEDEEKRIEDGFKGLSVKERVGFTKEWQEVRDHMDRMFPKPSRSPKSKL